MRQRVFTGPLVQFLAWSSVMRLKGPCRGSLLLLLFHEQKSGARLQRSASKWGALQETKTRLTSHLIPPSFHPISNCPCSLPRCPHFKQACWYLLKVFTRSLADSWRCHCWEINAHFYVFARLFPCLFPYSVLSFILSGPLGSLSSSVNSAAPLRLPFPDQSNKISTISAASKGWSTSLSELYASGLHASLFSVCRLFLLWVVWKYQHQGSRSVLFM